MRAVMMSAFAIALAGCTSHAPQVAGTTVTDPVPTKTARYCDPARSTGTHIPTCRPHALMVPPELFEDMTNNAAGVKRK